MPLILATLAVVTRSRTVRIHNRKDRERTGDGVRHDEFAEVETRRESIAGDGHVNDAVGEELRATGSERDGVYDGSREVDEHRQDRADIDVQQSLRSPVSRP